MMQEQIRKYQDHLAVSGGGVIIFGLWSLIKGIVYMMRTGSGAETLTATEAQYGNIVSIISIVVTITVLVIDIGLRLIVGLNARAEGHGRKRGTGYIVLAIIMAVISALFFILYVYMIIRGGYENGILDIVITVIVDITSLAAFLDVIISAFGLRRIGRLEERKEAV